MGKRGRKAEKERGEAIAELRKWLKPMDTVYTILRHVSRSGMVRHMSVVKIVEGEPLLLTHNVARALDLPIVLGPVDGVKVTGCGMDMGFHLVYELGRVLFPDGFDTPYGYWRNEPMKHDPDGGYALRQRWL